jgi:hypothetical protein
MDTMPSVATARRTRTRSKAAPAPDWLRGRTTTTPGRLVLLSILIAAGAVCFGLIATSAERSRAHAAEAVRARTEPLLVQAVTLYTALSDANATATTTFLKGGLEPPAERARYLSDVRTASDALAALTREVGNSSSEAAAVRTIIEQLPVYAGLVESARANNRQGLPIGAAYLRQASAVLTSTILPAADHLYATEAKRLVDDYSTGIGTTALVVLIAAIVVALVVLLLTQRYLTRVSRRILNVPVAIATVVLLVVSIWAVVGLLGEQSALASARRDSDSVELLSATSVLLSRAQSDESLILVNRGSDETDPLDFALVMHTLSGPGGLLAQSAAPADSGEAARARDRLSRTFAAYRAETHQVATLQNRGLTYQAIAAASSPSSIAIGVSLNSDLAGQVQAAQRRFQANTASATSWLWGLAIAIPLLTSVVAALTLLGLRQRLQEYR